MPRVTLAFLFFAIPLSVQTVRPATATTQATCSQKSYRAYDDNVTSEGRGVSGIFRIPGYIEANPQMVSGADVYLIEYGGSDFVQVGWYVGQASQLPYTATPRVFFGEAFLDGELLRPGAASAWGSYHVFKLLYSTSSGYWYFYVDGV